MVKQLVDERVLAWRNDFLVSRNQACKHQKKEKRKKACMQKCEGGE